MGFLLDGLHEDLNRRLKKPAVSKIESNQRPDELIARESWRRFLLRNDSLLVDRVYGQLRSHVTCTNCGKESVTFDPFNTLSLPVPIKTSKPLTILFRPLVTDHSMHSTPATTSTDTSSSLLIKLQVEVEMTDQIKDVKLKVIKKLVSRQKLNLSSSTTRTVLSSLTTMAPTGAQHNSRNSSSDIQEQEVEEDYIDISVNSPSSSRNNSARNGRVFPHSSSSSSASLVKATQSQTDTDRLLLRLQASSLSAHNQSKINKTLTDKTPVTDFLTGRECILIYQLDEPCPVKNTNLSYSYRGNNNTSSSQDDDGLTDDDKKVSYVDLYHGKLDAQYSTGFIETFGAPVRFNILPSITGKSFVYTVYLYLHIYLFIHIMIEHGISCGVVSFSVAPSVSLRVGIIQLLFRSH